MMLLVDSIYINNSGGKVMLDYLVEKLEANQVSVYYLFDHRCLGQYQDVPNSRKLFLKASLFNRHSFYKKNACNFTKVFCFGNLPPTIKLNIPVYTYLHQRLFLSSEGIKTLSTSLILKIKSHIFSYLLKNTNELYVQTDGMKKLVQEKYKNSNIKVEVIPFYRSNTKFVETNKLMSEKCLDVNILEPLSVYFEMFNNNIVPQLDRDLFDWLLCAGIRGSVRPQPSDYSEELYCIASELWPSVDF